MDYGFAHYTVALLGCRDGEAAFGSGAEHQGVCRAGRGFLLLRPDMVPAAGISRHQRRRVLAGLCSMAQRQDWIAERQ